MAVSTSFLVVASLSAGVLLHLFVLRHGEWNLYGPTFCGIGLLYWTVSFALATKDSLASSSVFSAAILATQLTWSAVFGIALSMSIYRFFFHRIRHFPGPLGGKLSSWWASRLHGERWHFYKGVASLHAQYGDYVRIAPDALSITDPAAVPAIHGQDSKCIKGSFYSIAEPQRNLLMIRNKQEHARKRRDWDRAFNVKSLNDYESTVWDYTHLLMNSIEKTLGKPTNIAKLLQFYAFDVMADLAFGKSFNCLRTQTPSRMMEEIEAPVLVFGLFHYVPWVAHFFKLVPFMVSHKAKFDAYLDSLVADRKRMPATKRDIFSWFLSAYNALDTKTDQDEKNLIGEAMLIVIAGSGPTAPAIAACLYHLAQRPDLVALIHEETRTIGFAVGETRHGQLGSLKLLDAVINEALRLHPPIRSGPERMSPPEGLFVGDVYIPGNIRLQTPLYPIHRDARSFTSPDLFLPERWLSAPHLMIDPSVCIPFYGSGTFSCVGKALALMQMRQVLASIVSQYKFTLASEAAGQEFEDNTTDYFACFANTLNVVFEARSELSLSLGKE